MSRGEIRDSTADELDVNAVYREETDGLTATVYLYETMTPDVPLWFDRALFEIRQSPEFGLSGTPEPVLTAFTRPGSAIASGLRTAMDTHGGGTTSTAVAIAPLGTWLVKVRLSSSRLDRAALDDRLTRFIAGLRWPAPAAPAATAGGTEDAAVPVLVERVAVPVLACERPLQLRPARIVADDMSQAIMSSVSGMVAARGTIEGRAPVYCREPGATIDHGVYRPNAATDAYMIALGDAGIVVSLSRAIDLSSLIGGRGGGSNRFSMTVLARDETAVYPSFNRLPPPEQALQVVLSRPATIASRTGHRASDAAEAPPK